jgi:hypothetical protein
MEQFSVVPVTKNMTIISELPDAVSLCELFESHCEVKHQDPAMVLIKARQAVGAIGDASSDSSGTGASSVANENDEDGEKSRKQQRQQQQRQQQRQQQLREQAFDDACSATSKNLLRNAMTKHGKYSCTAYMAKKQLAADLGVVTAVQLLLGAGGPAADQFFIVPATGHLAISEMTPEYATTTATDATSTSTTSTSASVSASTGAAGIGGIVAGDSNAANIGANTSAGATTSSGTSSSSSSSDVITASSINKLTTVTGVNRSGAAPARLTRNVTSALNSAIILGGTVVSLGCSLNSLVDNREVIEAYLMVYFMEDIRDRGLSSEENVTRAVEVRRGYKRK